MPRTPIPAHLIHDPKEVAENARLFDEFCKLIPEEVIPIEPLWPMDELNEEKMKDLLDRVGFKTREEPSLEEKRQENEERQKGEQKLIVGQIASSVVEQIRQKVEKEGELKLPFGLVVIKADKLSPVRAVFVSGQRKR